MKILEKDYSCAYWLRCELTDNEFQNFVKQLEEMHLLDGVDVDEKDVCLKFSQVKPKNIPDIKRAKLLNTQNCKRFLTEFSKAIDGRLYFNINHHIIKRK